MNQNNTKFYVMESDKIWSGKWATAEEVEPISQGEPPHKCPKCNSTVSMLEWLPKHFVQISTSNPKKFGDIMWIRPGKFLVSQHFLEIYQNAGLTGIEHIYEPVEIVKYGRKLPSEMANIPQYQLVRVSWDAANIDDQASEAVRKEGHGCDYCRNSMTSIKRIVFEPNSWDGSDILIPRGEASFIVTERFKQVMEQHNIHDAIYIPIAEFSWDERGPRKPGTE